MIETIGLCIMFAMTFAAGFVWGRVYQRDHNHD